VLEVVAPLPASARPKSLCNVGTAGALREGVAGTHVIGAAIQHDIDGESIERIVGTNPSPRLELGHGLTLATGDRFVADAATRDMLASRADLVDMEGYAVAFVARRLDLPVVLVKHVSDGADGEAVDSWIDSVARCSRQLGEHLRTTLLEPVRPVVTDQGG
jgi:adenosylhomocysteine nucleosidase